MKITHILNSFLIVDGGRERILCDPWLGYANYGGWHSFPFVDEAEVQEQCALVDYIYISHLHDDHLCANFLSRLDKQTPVIIRKFRDKSLKRVIAAIGFVNFIELSADESFETEDFVIEIIPQIESNSGSLVDQVSYDIDTSIFFFEKSTGQSFFNKVDNPISDATLVRICENLKTKYDCSINVIAMTCGAASEWPQCFLSLDRETKKSEFLRAEIEKFRIVVEEISPDFVINAGGMYVIPGKFRDLNQFLAIPSMSDLVAAFSEAGEARFFDLSGGRVLCVDSGTIKDYLKNTQRDISMPIPESDEFDGFRCRRFDHAERRRYFHSASKRFMELFNERSWEPDQAVDIIVYQELCIDERGDIDLSSSLKTDEFHLFPNLKTHSVATIHLDEYLFDAVLRGEILLNQLMSGSLTIQERNPDVFYPGTMFALNLFRAPK